MFIGGAGPFGWLDGIIDDPCKERHENELRKAYQLVQQDRKRRIRKFASNAFEAMMGSFFLVVVVMTIYGAVRYYLPR